MTVVRYDTGSMTRVERTPQGGIRAEARLTRVGILTYTNPDGTLRREYRPPEEVFHEDSLATLADAPVTNLHHGLVTTENWRRVSVGSLSGQARQDGKYVAGRLVVQDDHTIGQIEAGDRREVSCGYTCKLDPTPGVTPEGERYDAIQRRIRYNHVALVRKGRAGSDVVLRLDSDGNQTGLAAQETSTTMKIEIIGGTEYEVGTAAHRKATQEREDAARETRVRLDSVSELEGRIEALEAENKQLREDAEASGEKLAAAVKARVELVETASKAGVEAREDMSDADLRRAVIEKVLPDMRLDGKDEAFVAGVFSAATAKLGRDTTTASAARVREDAERARTGDDSRDDYREDAALPPDARARNRMIQRSREAARSNPSVDKG